MEGIEDSAAHGAFWTILCSIANKGFTFLGQIGLAWLLVPSEFGLVALALSVTNIIGTLAPSGFREVLIQQHDRFEEYAGQVFWLSLALKITVAVLVVASAPIAGDLFSDQRLTPLIMIAGLTLPLDALTTIYSANLNVNLRFRIIAFINLGAGVLHTGSAILLAWYGFGAYSLILPLIWVKIYQAVTQRLVAEPFSVQLPKISAWVGLIVPASWFITIAGFNALQTYGPNIAIGLFQDASITGLFFWGFQVSTQALFVLALSLRNVLFPTLAKLNDNCDKQTDFFMKSCSLLILITMPICILQAILAEPVIEVIFEPKWLNAVPVVRWLSLGMLTLPLNVMSTSILMAQGCFKKLALLTGLISTATVGAAIAGAVHGQQESIAIAVGVSYFLTYLASGWVAFRNLNIARTKIVKVVIFPIALTLPSNLFSIALIILGDLKPFALIASVTAGYFLLYLSMCHTFQRDLLQELFLRIRAQLPPYFST